MNKKVLITDELHPTLQQQLESRGYDCDVRPTITTAEVVEIIRDYLGLVISTSIKVRQPMVDAATSLKFIARAGSGMENIDVDSATSKDILCVNSPEGNCDAVAEQALGGLLTLFANIHKGDREIRQGIWQREPNRGIEIKNKTVGIIGLGHTGSAFAKRLSGFECRVLAYDKYKTEQSEFAKMVEMEIIFKEADIVSFHLPLTPETHFLVRDEYLARFSKDIFIINTSRGKVVKTTGLISALKSGKVRGAVLDVFENEHLDTFSEADKSWFKELTTIPQVILTPHVAGWTHESKQRIAEVLVEKLTQHGF